MSHPDLQDVVDGRRRVHEIRRDARHVAFLAERPVRPGHVIVATCARLQSQLLGNPCTISQAAMLEACNNPQPQLLAERLAAYDQRRRFLVEAIDPLPGVSLPTPKGAFYALIDIRRLCDARGIDDVTACGQLLEDHQLALVPGSAFAAPGFLRASFATSMDNLQKAAARFRAWVEAC